MFERYRNEVDSLRLSDEATDRVLKTLNTPYKAPRPLPIRKLVAIAACVALLVAAATTNTKKPTVSLYPEKQKAPAINVTLPAAHLTYAEVFALLEEMNGYRGESEWVTDDAILPELGTPTMGTQTGAAIDKGDSSTNTQYQDVDEADYVKAQNGYIYVLDSINGHVTVYRADGDKTAAVAVRTPIDRKRSELRNMYLTEDRLVVLYTRYDTVTVNVTPDTTADDVVGAPTKSTSTGTIDEFCKYDYSYMKSYTYAAVYDITDPTDPRPLTEYGQDGNLVDSRMVDGVLYLVTDPRVYGADQEDPVTFVPSLYRDDTQRVVTEDCLYATVEPNTANYALVTAVSVEGDTARLAEKAVLGAGYATVWANTAHMMLMQRQNRSNTTDTENEDGTIQRTYDDCTVTALTLLDLTDGALTVKATAEVEGEPDNAFAMDEWNGHFRLAVTYTRYYGSHTVVTDPTGHYGSHPFFESQQERFNRLYVLDSTLTEVGRIDDLAPDEMVQSVRFDGAIGYVVTFRQTDPLFAIDLADPTNPTVLSALKITGFSEYMHPFGENRLLGVGYAGTEDGLNGRLKLTMFDTADKTDVTVNTFLELPESHHSSDALWDHHAVLVDTARGIIGLPIVTHGGRMYELYRYTEEGGFTTITTTPTVDVPFMRGMFLGNHFYLAHTDGVAVYTADLTPIMNVSPSI